MNSSIEPRQLWRPYMEELFRDIKDLDLKKDKVLIDNLEYMKDVAYLLETTDQTLLGKNRRLFPYCSILQSSTQNVFFRFPETAIWWIVIDIMTPHSPQNLRKLWQNYVEKVTDYESYSPTSIYCAEMVNWMMGGLYRNLYHTCERINYSHYNLFVKVWRSRGSLSIRTFTRGKALTSSRCSRT